MSSFEQTCSPFTTVSDSSRGISVNCSRTTVGSSGVTGARASAGGAGRGRAGTSWRTRRMNSSTSWLRGTKATTKSSSPIFPTSSSRLAARSHGYWLWSTIARRCSGSSSGTASLQSRIAS